jgi:hypothetical protein
MPIKPGSDMCPFSPNKNAAAATMTLPWTMPGFVTM